MCSADKTQENKLIAASDATLFCFKVLQQLPESKQVLCRTFSPEYIFNSLEQLSMHKSMLAATIGKTMKIKAAH